QCRSSSFHILTPTRPAVQLNCSNLLFAPYNTSYIKLPEHMKKTGLCKDLNLWNKPLITYPAHMFNKHSCTIILRKSRDCFIPCFIPIEYENALDKRQKSISLLANEITDAQLN
ncbi:unnamed protein product, partial [Didymodactylos carnosus]